MERQKFEQASCSILDRVHQLTKLAWFQGKVMRLKSVAACVALCPSVIGASTPLRIQPSSAWVLEYADDSCRLIRLFGTGSTLTRLVFEGVAPEKMTMLLVGGTLRAVDSGAGVKARLLPGTGELFTGTAAEPQGGVKGAAFWVSIPLTPGWKDDRKPGDGRYVSDSAIRKSINPIERDAAKAKRTALAASTTELSIIPASGRAMVLETGSLGKPLAMFDECERDLLRQWGVDPAIQEMIVKPVWAPSPLAWFSSDDYPSSALARNEESTVNVRLAVDSSGKVTKCVSLSAYSAPEFNKVVCNVFLKRAKFAPAELVDGTKVASYYSENITFKIPTY